MRSDVVKRFFRIAWFEIETLLHLHLFPPDLLTFAQRALCGLAIFARDFAESFRRRLGLLPL
jgi:hypothetical protein